MRGGCISLFFICVSFFCIWIGGLEFPQGLQKTHGRNIDGFARACCLSLWSRKGGKQNNAKENSCCPNLLLLGNKAASVSVTSDILRWLFKRYSFVGKDRVNPKRWHYLSGSWSIQADKTSVLRRKLGLGSRYSPLLGKFLQGSLNFLVWHIYYWNSHNKNKSYVLYAVHFSKLLVRAYLIEISRQLYLSIMTPILHMVSPSLRVLKLSHCNINELHKQ